MQAIKKLTLAMAALMLASMACANIPYGEIISSEDATQRALPSPTPVEESELDQARFSVGDTAVIVGGKFGALVPLFGNPGDAFFSSQVLNGTPVTILGLRDLNDVVWYRVEGMTGEGWLVEENLVTEEEFAAAQAEKAAGSAQPTPETTPTPGG